MTQSLRRTHYLEHYEPFRISPCHARVFPSTLLSPLQLLSTRKNKTGGNRSDSLKSKSPPLQLGVGVGKGHRFPSIQVSKEKEPINDIKRTKFAHPSKI